MLTVGQIAENCFLVRREGSDRAADRRPRRGGRADPRRASRRPAATVEAILLTHSTSTTSAPSPRSRRRPARRSTARRSRCRCSPTSCAFVPWPGFGPYESYDADETVAGGETLELAGLSSTSSSPPATAPATSPTRSAARTRSSPATSSSRARSAASTCPAATGRPCSSSIRTPARLPPRRDRRLSRPHGDHDARRRAGDQPVPRRAGPLGARPAPAKVAAPWRASSRHPRGTFDVLPEQAPRAGADRGAPRRRSSPAPATSRSQTPDLRGHRPVRARRRQVDRHRPQGDVHLRGQGRAQPHPAAGGRRRRSAAPTSSTACRNWRSR